VPLPVQLPPHLPRAGGGVRSRRHLGARGRDRPGPL